MCAARSSLTDITYLSKEKCEWASSSADTRAPRRYCSIRAEPHTKHSAERREKLWNYWIINQLSTFHEFHTRADDDNYIFIRVYTTQHPCNTFVQKKERGLRWEVERNVNNEIKTLKWAAQGAERKIWKTSNERKIMAK